MTSNFDDDSSENTSSATGASTPGNSRSADLEKILTNLGHVVSDTLQKNDECLQEIGTRAKEISARVTAAKEKSAVNEADIFNGLEGQISDLAKKVEKAPCESDLDCSADKASTKAIDRDATDVARSEAIEVDAADIARSETVETDAEGGADWDQSMADELAQIYMEIENGVEEINSVDGGARDRGVAAGDVTGLDVDKEDVAQKCETEIELAPEATPEFKSESQLNPGSKSCAKSDSIDANTADTLAQGGKAVDLEMAAKSSTDNSDAIEGDAIERVHDDQFGAAAKDVTAPHSASSVSDLERIAVDANDGASEPNLEVEPIEEHPLEIRLAKIAMRIEGVLGEDGADTVNSIEERFNRFDEKLNLLIDQPENDEALQELETQIGELKDQFQHVEAQISRISLVEENLEKLIGEVKHSSGEISTAVAGIAGTVAGGLMSVKPGAQENVRLTELGDVLEKYVLERRENDKYANGALTDIQASLNDIVDYLIANDDVLSGRSTENQTAVVAEFADEPLPEFSEELVAPHELGGGSFSPAISQPVAPHGVAQQAFAEQVLAVEQLTDETDQSSQMTGQPISHELEADVQATGDVEIYENEPGIAASIREMDADLDADLNDQVAMEAVGEGADELDYSALSPDAPAEADVAAETEIAGESSEPVEVSEYELALEEAEVLARQTRAVTEEVAPVEDGQGQQSSADGADDAPVSPAVDVLPQNEIPLRQKMIEDAQRAAATANIAEPADTNLAGDAVKAGNFMAAARNAAIVAAARAEAERDGEKSQKDKKKRGLFSFKLGGASPVLIFATSLLTATTAGLVYSQIKDQTGNSHYAMNSDASFEDNSGAHKLDALRPSDVRSTITVDQIGRQTKSEAPGATYVSAKINVSEERTVINEVPHRRSETTEGLDVPVGIVLDAPAVKPGYKQLAAQQRRQKLAKMSSDLTMKNMASGLPTLAATNIALKPEAGLAKPKTQAPANIAPTLALPPASIGPFSLRIEAAKGDAGSQFDVASRYAQGQGIKRNYKEAAKWYGRAAAQGHAIAQYRLAALYEKGLGVSKDLARARTWYGRSAKKGNVKAMHNLAVLYTGQKKSHPDYATAARWFKSAAEHGLADSQFNLAILYANGLGVKASKVNSYKWFSLASARGDDEAAKRKKVLKGVMTASEIKTAEGLVQNWSSKPVLQNANNTRKAAALLKKSGGNLDRNMIRQVTQVQTMLNKLGYKVGAADGRMGPKTREAIRTFQRRSGMKINGEVTPVLISRLSGLVG